MLRHLSLTTGKHKTCFRRAGLGESLHVVGNSASLAKVHSELSAFFLHGCTVRAGVRGVLQHGSGVSLLFVLIQGSADFFGIDKWLLNANEYFQRLL